MGPERNREISASVHPPHLLARLCCALIAEAALTIADTDTIRDQTLAIVELPIGLRAPSQCVGVAADSDCSASRSQSADHRQTSQETLIRHLRYIEHVFNVLNMRLREQPYRKDPPADLNTRARIRDAAIVVFGEEGFGVGVRAIAKAAGVSPGLVNHHFGSKDGLRAECDEHVRSLIRTAKTEYVLEPSPTATLQALTEIEEYAPLIAYLMRTFQVGGALLVTWFEHMVADVEAYLAVGIEAGTLRSPTDLGAMARYLATQGGGGFFLFLQLHAAKHDGAIDYRKALREFAEQMMLPAVEMSTHGLFTDSTLLDALRAEQ